MRGQEEPSRAAGQADLRERRPPIPEEQQHRGEPDRAPRGTARPPAARAGSRSRRRLRRPAGCGIARQARIAAAGRTAANAIDLRLYRRVTRYRNRMPMKTKGAVNRATAAIPSRTHEPDRREAGAERRARPALDPAHQPLPCPAPRRGCPPRNRDGETCRTQQNARRNRSAPERTTNPVQVPNQLVDASIDRSALVAQGPSGQDEEYGRGRSAGGSALSTRFAEVSDRSSTASTACPRNWSRR